TNVKREDGSRAIGTLLDPNGKVIEFINMSKAFYGAATILGKPYLTGYEPIHDVRNNVIGIYYFGYIVRGSLAARCRESPDNPRRPPRPPPEALLEEPAPARLVLLGPLATRCAPR